MTTDSIMSSLKKEASDVIYIHTHAPDNLGESYRLNEQVQCKLAETTWAWVWV